MNDDESEIVEHRRKKLSKLRELGKAFPVGFERTHLAGDLHKKYLEVDKETLQQQKNAVVVAGRVMLRRIMGKASFITIQDPSANIQCYLRAQELGQVVYDEFTELTDRGDIVGVSGVMMRTNKGELTIHASAINILTKSIQPLPEKYHGIVDQELKYRQRYIDLIMNADSRRVFETRSQVIRVMRDFFDRRGYLEVETPMMHPLPGGASARPFITHHNSLDMDLYLRIAPELYLKRLVVGGYERVYEVNRCFRNEGVSTRHNPEFTMLEFYQAYATFRDLMVLTEHLLREVVSKTKGSETVFYQDREIDFGSDFRKISMIQSVSDALNVSLEDLDDPEKIFRIAGDHAIKVPENAGAGRVLVELFESKVEKTLLDPTFITHYPAEVSPLARRSDDHPNYTDRFELFIAGRECANGFSELNDPEDQRERFKLQAAAKESGDDEAMHYDADYITALEYGMPPTAGEGIGIDRLLMLLTDKPSIRDVLLFPHLKPKV